MLKSHGLVFGWGLLALGTLASFAFLLSRPPRVIVQGVQQATRVTVPPRWFYPRGTISTQDLLAIGGHFHGMALLWPGPTVVGATHLGVLFSGDGGVSWQLLRPGFSVHGMGRAVASMNGQILVVQGEGIGLGRSEDGGATWTSIGQSLPPHEVRALAMDPANPNRLLLWVGSLLAESTDGGRHWSLVRPQHALPPALSLALHPMKPERIYAGTERGVWISQDGGHTWLPPRRGAPVTPVLSLAIPPGYPDLLLAGSEAGLFLGFLDLSQWRSLPAPSEELGPIVAFAFGRQDHATVFAMTHRGQVVSHPLRDLLAPPERATRWVPLDLEPAAAPCLDSLPGQAGFSPC